jgi:hypothetical protein
LPQLLQYDRLAIKLAQIKNRKRCDKNKEARMKKSDKYMWTGGILCIVGIFFIAPKSLIAGAIIVGIGCYFIKMSLSKGS